MGGVLLSFFAISANAQQTQPDTTQPRTTQPQTWDAKKNPTVEAITAPHESKLLPPRAAVTIDQVFPVLGQYQSTSNPEAANVKVSLDAENKGLVWIEGLPQGRVKAMLRKSPATYKIPAQKTEDGKDVAEGTMIYDKDANTLNIAIGKTYNAEDPATAFAPEPEQPVVAEVKTKGKKTKIKTEDKPKAWLYSATKIESSTAINQ